MCNRFFENLTRQFITDLQFKRYKRLQRLQCHSYQEIIGDIFDPVDFQIEQCTKLNSWFALIAFEEKQSFESVWIYMTKTEYVVEELLA